MIKKIVNCLFRNHLPKVLISLVCLQTACVERYEIDLSRGEPSYIVEGMLMDDTRYQYVKVFQTDPRSKNQPVDAIVSLERETGAMTDFFKTEEDGIYKPLQMLSINTGEKYKLHIQINDELKIESEWETIPEKIEIAEAYWEQKTKTYYNLSGYPLRRTGFDFIVNTAALPGDDVFLRYNYETTHINEAPFTPPLCSDCRNCYIRSVPNNFINSINIEGSKNKPLLAHPIQFVELDIRFSFRFTMLVQQIAHTKSAGEFYHTLTQQQSLRGSIFDPPPPILRGNLFFTNDPNEVVYGLFEVGRIHETVITVLRGDFENEIITYRDRCMTLAQNNALDAKCLTCWAETGAGPRPYYF